MPGSKKFLLCLTFLSGLFFSTESYSQNSSSSPYSRYALGDLLFSGFVRNLGMGGTGQAVFHPLHQNPVNPASFTHLRLTTYEAGVNFQMNKLATSVKSQSDNTASLAYFALGFPVVQKKWGMGFGLHPYSTVGYSVEEERINSLLLKETHTYKGSGGLNEFYLSNGFAIAKNFSAGINVSYLFGVINQDRRVEFDEPSYFNSNISQSSSLGWFNFKLGLQYTFDSLKVAPSDSLKLFTSQVRAARDSMKTLDRLISAAPDSSNRQLLLDSRIQLDSSIKELKNSAGAVSLRRVKSDWDLSFGLSLSPSSELRGRQSILAYNFKYIGSEDRNQISVRDTTANAEGIKGNIKLPFNAGFGMALKKGTRWLFAADFSMQQWSDFSYFGQNDSLTDSWEINVGTQFTPNDRAIQSYLSQIQYRAGFHYTRSFLELRGEQISETGISIGFGFPIRRAGTVVHLSAEAGRRGTTSGNLVKEDFLRFTLGFTLNDRWFVKPKYD